MDGQDKGQEIYNSMLSRIKDARKKQGITQSVIANHLGVRPATYSEIERGERTTNAARIFAILEYLGINPFKLEDEVTELAAISTDDLKNAVQELATTNNKQSEVTRSQQNTIAQLAETNSILAKENAELKEALKQKEEAKQDDDTGSTD